MTSTKPGLLLVEPDRHMGRQLAGHLATSFRVRTAVAGRDALQAMELLPADVVLMELDLPGELGIGLLAELRKTWAETILVPMYSEGDHFLRMEPMLREVADALLAKPVDPEELEDTLNRLCRSKHAGNLSDPGSAGGAIQ